MIAMAGLPRDVADVLLQRQQRFYGVIDLHASTLK
jgi:hypothetical protein